MLIEPNHLFPPSLMSFCRLQRCSVSGYQGCRAIAGLLVLRIINEPTTATIAYCITHYRLPYNVIYEFQWEIGLKLYRMDANIDIGDEKSGMDMMAYTKCA